MPSHAVSLPMIEVQPGNVSVPIGGTASITVVASGGGLGYQWFGSDGQALTDSDGEIEGSRTATVQILNVEPDDAGEYSVQVSNAAGSVTSDEAVLLVGECMRMNMSVWCK